MFEAEATRIEGAAGGQLLALEHIGSTSVPGLPAKPMIDIMATVTSYEEGRHLVVPLRRIGYLYYAENDIPRRHYFDLEDAGGHDIVHLHVLEQGSSDARNHLLFRDYLRSHPETRAEYAALKRQLIARYATNRRLYTEAKADFIQAVIVVAAASL